MGKKEVFPSHHYFVSRSKYLTFIFIINPSPVEPRYAQLLQTVKIQISWLQKKPTDLDLHC